jgi:hypothetical protein
MSNNVNNDSCGPKTADFGILSWLVSENMGKSRHRKLLLLLIVFAGCAPCGSQENEAVLAMQTLQVSGNGRFLQYENGEPFFWLGDTGWLVFQKLGREEANRYLQNRCDKGFNVVQAILIHELPQTNFYGDTAFIDEDPTRPNTTPGSSYEDAIAYDYWDHVDYVVALAAEKGIYMALVPIWGSVAKTRSDGDVWATTYASWLAHRFKDRPNVIWLNGGDIRGDVVPQVWQQIGTTLDRLAPRHLITFHPFGRTQSSTWFHSAPWLDFNMFQSGHRRYDQMRATDDPTTWKGEDNWKYVVEDYAREPVKPTIDGEPSYENIPQGLHDPEQPYWTAADARRYAYWSVFAGALGHTYGNNSVMQMHKPDDGEGDYGVRNFWYEAMDDPGAGQTQHLKNLILSRPFYERIPDQSLIAGQNGEKYEYVVATRGNSYALFYTYTGRAFEVVMGKISGKRIKAQWFNPRDGEITFLSWFDNLATRHFDPPGKQRPGNDWVLILDGDD